MFLQYITDDIGYLLFGFDNLQPPLALSWHLPFIGITKLANHSFQHIRIILGLGIDFEINDTSLLNCKFMFVVLNTGL
jgi:hypothetical protein